MEKGGGWVRSEVGVVFVMEEEKKRKASVQGSMKDKETSEAVMKSNQDSKSSW